MSAYYLKYKQIPPDDMSDMDFDAFKYYHDNWPKLTEEDILRFEKNYKNSDEEVQDLLNCYEKFCGNFDKVFDDMFLATLDDVERYLEIIDEKIKDKNSKAFKAFKKGLSKNKRARLTREAKEVAADAEKNGGVSLDLMEALKANSERHKAQMQQLFEDFEKENKIKESKKAVKKSKNKTK